MLVPNCFADEIDYLTLFLLGEMPACTLQLLQLLHEATQLRGLFRCLCWPAASVIIQC